MFEFVLRNFLRLRSRFDTVAEIVLQFRLRVPEHGRIVGSHGDVRQVVEVGEQGDMAEFRHAGDENETFQVFTGFNRRIEAFQNAKNCICLRIRYVVQNGFVIFIDQDDHLFAFAQSGNQRFKAGCIGLSG